MGVSSTLYTFHTVSNNGFTIDFFFPEPTDSSQMMHCVYGGNDHFQTIVSFLKVTV